MILIVQLSICSRLSQSWASLMSCFRNTTCDEQVAQQQLEFSIHCWRGSCAASISLGTACNVMLHSAIIKATTNSLVPKTKEKEMQLWWLGQSTKQKSQATDKFVGEQKKTEKVALCISEGLGMVSIPLLQLHASHNARGFQTDCQLVLV